jgi:hypothetical protein
MLSRSRVTNMKLTKMIFPPKGSLYTSTSFHLSLVIPQILYLIIILGPICKRSEDQFSLLRITIIIILIKDLKVLIKEKRRTNIRTSNPQ